MDDLKNKDDGLALIRESQYTIENLRDYVQTTVYANKCEFLSRVPPPSINEICRHFKAFLVDKMTLEEIFPLFVTASITYFLDGANHDNMDERISFMYQTFAQADTLSPLHVHLAAKGIWETLKKPDDITYVFCILNLCKHLSIASESSKAIGIALAWTILAEITETETEMYCFHEFSEINTMLKEIDEEMLKVENIFGGNQIYAKVGYRNYFKFKQRDLEELKLWLENLSATFKVNATNTTVNYWDLRMSMTEYMNSIIALLHDKVTDMSDSGMEV